MSWVKSVSTLKDFLSLVIVHAPDDFPEEDFLPADEQLNLERAFAELYRGLELLLAGPRSPAQASELRLMLDQSLAAYRNGDDIQGAHLLQAFEAQAFA